MEVIKNGSKNKESSYLVSSIMTSGFDWHDISTVSEFLKEGDEYVVSDPMLAIAGDMRRFLEHCSVYEGGPDEEPRIVASLESDEIPSVSEILDHIKNDEPFTVESGDNPLYGPGYISFEYIPSSMNEAGEPRLSGRIGAMSYGISYGANEVDKENIIYIPAENFMAPFKGSPSVVRFYDSPFKSRQDAEKALSDMQLHSSPDGPVYSRKEMLVFDLSNNSMEKTWYDTNMEIVTMLQNHPEWNSDEHFRIDVREHLNHLMGLGKVTSGSKRMPKGAEDLLANEDPYDKENMDSLSHDEDDIEYN